jgi:hypothetical protein
MTSKQLFLVESLTMITLSCGFAAEINEHTLRNSAFAVGIERSGYFVVS